MWDLERLYSLRRDGNMFPEHRQECYFSDAVQTLNVMSASSSRGRILVNDRDM